MQSTQNAQDPHLFRSTGAWQETRLRAFYVIYMLYVTENFLLTFSTRAGGRPNSSSKVPSIFKFLSLRSKWGQPKGHYQVTFFNRLLSDFLSDSFICWSNADILLFQNRNWDYLALPGAQFIFIVLVHDVVTQHTKMGPPSLKTSPPPPQNQHHHQHQNFLIRSKFFISYLNEELLMKLMTLWIRL